MTSEISKSVMFMSFMLWLVGVFLIIWGCVHEDGLLMWIIGLFLINPFIFFAVQTIRAYKARDPMTRKELMDSIPEIA